MDELMKDSPETKDDTGSNPAPKMDANDSGVGDDYDEEESARENALKAGLDLKMTKELTSMMYAFGDDAHPYTETVAMMEDVVHRFIADTCTLAMASAQSERITVESLLYTFRRDKLKFQRLKELISEKRNLKQLRGAFNSDPF